MIWKRFVIDDCCKCDRPNKTGKDGCPKGMGALVTLQTNENSLQKQRSPNVLCCTSTDLAIDFVTPFISIFKNSRNSLLFAQLMHMLFACRLYMCAVFQTPGDSFHARQC